MTETQAEISRIIGEIWKAIDMHPQSLVLRRAARDLAKVLEQIEGDEKSGN